MPNHDSSHISDYLSKIGRFPVLTKEAQLLHCRRIREYLDWPGGKEQAPQRIRRLGERSFRLMVETNTRLVVHLAKRYQNRGLELSDLIQEGSLGLIRGLELFDPTRGYAFSTYSYWWIRQSICRAIYNTARTIRLPVNVQDTSTKVRRFTQQFLADHNRNPTLPEIAAEFDLTLERLNDILSSCVLTDCLSMDSLCQLTDTSLSEILTTPNPTSAESPELATLATERDDLLQKALTQLDERERRVITVLHFEGGNTTQLASEFDVSRHTVSTLHKKALNKLRRSLVYSWEAFER